MGSVARTSIAAAALLVFASPAVAQYPIPNQLSVGIGGVRDRHPAQTTPAFTVSAAWADSGNAYWPYRLGLVFEGELGPTSDAAPCQVREPQSAEPQNCEDAAALVGIRFHFYRRAQRQRLPFVNFLFGSYWRGSGVGEDDYESARYMLEAGGGIDLRRGHSVNGLRVSLDYRHVFGSDGARDQLRFLVAYVLGPPRP